MALGKDYFKTYIICVEKCNIWKSGKSNCSDMSITGGTWSTTLVQVMACCLMAPSHYLNQCSFIISRAQLAYVWSNFTGNAQDINPKITFKNYTTEIIPTSQRGQGVISLRPSDACMCQWIIATLVQIMAYCLDDTKTLSEPMLVYCQLEP